MFKIPQRFANIGYMLLWFWLLIYTLVCVCKISLKLNVSVFLEHNRRIAEKRHSLFFLFLYSRSYAFLKISLSSLCGISSTTLIGADKTTLCIIISFFGIVLFV